jgi:hypothetical protein
MQITKLETERLTLSTFVESDADGLVGMRPMRPAA